MLNRHCCSTFGPGAFHEKVQYVKREIIIRYHGKKVSDYVKLPKNQEPFNKATMAGTGMKKDFNGDTEIYNRSEGIIPV